jgi:prepilin-type N-terminal cleavage/methylation domain-containing protein
MEYILRIFNRFSHKQNSGFTLIELLVVIIIIGILATITLGTMFNFIKKAKQVEGITYVNTCQKKQLAYYAENNQFTDSLELLGLPKETNNYMFKVDIFPPTKPEDGNQTFACCMAGEKGGGSDMVFMCASSGG